MGRFMSPDPLNLSVDRWLPQTRLTRPWLLAFIAACTRPFNVVISLGAIMLGITTLSALQNTVSSPSDIPNQILEKVTRARAVRG
jgi:hypothetical protein